MLRFRFPEIAGRRNFERLYDVPERVLPRTCFDCEPVAADEAKKALLVRAARAMGVGTAKDIAQYFHIDAWWDRSRVNGRLKPVSPQPLFDELVEERRLERVHVEGWMPQAYVVPAFAAGVAAATGNEPAGMTSVTPAWADDAQGTIILPCYYQWEFGTGASDEVGHDLLQYAVRRALVVTDPGVAATGHPQRIAAQMAQFGIEAVVYDGAHVEPTDESMQRAIDWARAEGPWDAFVAVGGGSAIDTAKAVNLLTSNEGELMDYVNAPVGKARNPEQPLKPLVAVPTTTGTGAESTTVCVLDVLSLKVKTGISHARLRPTLAVVDPTLTMSQPAGVTAASGMDILCHALESYTARPYTSYDRKQPEQRVPYCGSNPIAANGKILVRAPIRVRPSTTTCDCR